MNVNLNNLPNEVPSTAVKKEITYSDIKNVNATLSKTNIKGKKYIEVNERIKAFRVLFPLGKIITNLISNENGVCVFRAEIYTNEDRLLATGTAYEKESSTFINKTSYIENCETSAVGRALGMCGFGIDTSIASAEEVQNAITNQQNPPKQEPPQPPQLPIQQVKFEINQVARKKGVKSSEVLSEVQQKVKYPINEAVNLKQAEEVINLLHQM